MAIEIIKHGVNWVNNEKLNLKCPECEKKRTTKEIEQKNDSVEVVFTCEVCGCVFKLEREIPE